LGNESVKAVGSNPTFTASAKKPRPLQTAEFRCSRLAFVTSLNESGRMTRPSGPLLFILATLMIDAIGIGIVFPIMPDLMARVGAGDLAQGSIWAGVLMAAYAGAQFLFAPVVGSLSDAFGRRPVLLAALAMLALDYVIMALAGTLWLLILGRTLAGLAGATYITATAYIADISSPGERAARFGLIGAAFGIGFVIGPALGGSRPHGMSGAVLARGGAVGAEFRVRPLHPAGIAQAREPQAVRRAGPQPVRNDPIGVPRAGAGHSADLHRGVRVRQHGLPHALGVLGARGVRLVDAGDRAVAVGLRHLMVVAQGW
jgi:hypothetical protein